MVTLLLGVGMPGADAARSPLVCDPSRLAFGKVVTGQSATLPVTLSNRSSAAITVTQVTVSSAAFTVNDFSPPVTIAAGQSVNFTVTFSPTTVGIVNAVITAISSVGPCTFQVTGHGVNDWTLIANPASLAFGNVQVGSKSTLPQTITNGGSASATVNLGQVGGLGYSVSGVTLPMTLGAGQSFTFNVSFAPTASGSSPGSILATSDSNPVLTIPLSGTGVTAGQLTVSPSTISFGNVTVGQTASQSGQLSAANANVTVSAGTMSNSVFALTGLSLPVTIAAGQSINYTVSFTPQNNGTASGTLSFTSDAANSPTAQSLTGTGMAAQHSVGLSWDPSSSQVSGYNVYRGNQPGGPYAQLNSGLDPNTAYTDSSVMGGQTYYYATTAVNSEGEESGYSNQIQAVIP
jgi:Abnormal spindle-like microcephaly-assoc'd, ASPM-SPD-2-Hydin